MPTELYSNHLEILLEADTHAGANGANVSQLDDESGNGRDFTASSNYPTILTNAVNSKKAVDFSGANSPLVWSGASFPLACFFLVAKINALDNFDGIVTDANANPILVGNPGNNQFWNNKYPYFEVRVNDHIYRLNAHRNDQPPIQMGEWAIYYGCFYKPITVSSLQIGQDRADTSRRADMEFAVFAAYSNYWIGEGGEQATRKNMESLAWSYQIPIYDVFPYQRTKTDTGETKAFTVSDGQPRPIVSQKSDPYDVLDCSFQTRDWREFDAAKDYLKARAFTGKTFIFRDFDPVGADTPAYFDAQTGWQYRGSVGNRKSYGFTIIGTEELPDRYIPDQPDFTGIPIVDTVPPSNVTGLAYEIIKPTQANYSWNAATDNIGVKGYLIQRSTSNTFPASHLTQSFETGNVTAYQDTTLTPNTTYYVRIKAKDEQNYSVAWSSTVSFTTPAIPDTTPPQVTMQPPPSTVSGTVTLSAVATDTESGVLRVDFYLVNQAGTVSRYLGTQATPNAGTNTYSFSWNTTVDGDGVPVADGTYTIGAIAYDKATPANESAPSFQPNITVANAAPQAPVMSSLAASGGENQITVTGAFSGASTITGVDLEWSATGDNATAPFNTAGTGWTVLLNNAAPDSQTADEYIHAVVGQSVRRFYRMRVRAGAAISGWRTATAQTNPQTGEAFYLQEDSGYLTEEGMRLTELDFEG